MEQFVVTNAGARPDAAGVIEGCRRGDRDAFRQLFEAHKDRVYSVALYFFGGDEATASDITQQVFLKLFTRVGQFRGDSEFSTWLYRLATNTCLDEARRRRRFLPFGDSTRRETSAQRDSQEASLARDETAHRVREALAELRPKLRMAILLKYFEELSYEEIAEVLGCSKGTVASRLNRAHKALAHKLGHLRGALLRDETS
ncbi:MAG TPA: sigma-70 family RNA polymerase sigma factor [Pyrinomonadaceae bacterium]|nr:sigma-70 family RNA polymerase sigma factor [Pyrinomonadaceae bacterium]